MVGIPGRFENMGFMLARHAAWRMQATCGDGASGAVAIGAATLRSLLRPAAAGFDPRQLACEAECAVQRTCDAIATMSESLCRTEIPAYLSTLIDEPGLVPVVVEAIDLLGPEASIVVRSSVEPRVHLQCIEGALWESTSVLAPALPPGGSSLRLTNPAMLLWDAPATDVREFAVAMAAVQQSAAPACVLIARSFAPDVLGLIARNGDLRCRIIPFVAPQAGAQQDEAYGDLAALTGARRLAPEAGDRLGRLTVTDLGSAPRITIGPRFINVMSGRARQSAIDERIGMVERLIEQCEDDRALDRLQERRGRLRQGLGVVWVGAHADSERDRLRRQASRGIDGLRAAMASGVVPGGGSAILAMSRLLRCEDATVPPGALAVADGLEAPARWIAQNAGLDPQLAVSHMDRDRQCSDPGSGSSGGGIHDAASTVATMVQVGVSMAISAFECDVLISRPVSLSQAETRP
jgi:chaperonin GroEL